MSRDDDQVDISLLRSVGDFFARHALTELEIAICVLLLNCFGDRFQRLL
jgi:hypothetical protein